MKNILAMALVLAAAGTAAHAAEEEKPWRYVDAQELRVINKGWDNTYIGTAEILKDWICGGV